MSTIYQWRLLLFMIYCSRRPVTRFAMHRKTNLLVTSTRSSICCANLILMFSVNFVHKKHPGVQSGMLPSYRTMKYKSPIWGYFHVQKE